MSARNSLNLRRCLVISFFAIWTFLHALHILLLTCHCIIFSYLAFEQQVCLINSIKFSSIHSLALSKQCMLGSQNIHLHCPKDSGRFMTIFRNLESGGSFWTMA